MNGDLSGRIPGPARVVRPAGCRPPLISVVLPTFNRAALLPESIESVLKQTEPRWELIIVDDGASDSTPEVIEKYAERDNRIAVIRQPNCGLPRALNAGFRVARGEFHTWTSDDNRYLPEAFAIMGRYLLRHPAVGLVYAEMLWRTTEGLVHTPTVEPDDVWSENKFGGAFMYRRTVAERVGEYDPSLEMVEDYDFFLRASYQAALRHLPYILYEFRSDGDSLSNLRRPEQIRGLEKLLRRHMALGRANPSQLGRLAVAVSGNYRRQGWHSDSLRLAAMAWRLRPLHGASYLATVRTLLHWLCRGRLRRKDPGG